MENPKQTIYAPEELFALKPEAIKAAAVTPATPSVNITNDVPTVVVPSNINQPGYWGKYKAYIIGGIVVLGCIGLFYYSENEKKKKNRQKN